jgi:hypothetical protein
MRILLLILLVPFLTIHSQELHHQALSAQGTSKELSNGIYVSQTIGQQSVIGNYTKDDKTYGQGFQQSTWSKYVISSSNNPISTVAYPIPFLNYINFQFSEPINEQIHLELFDVRGRLVFQTDQLPTGNLLTIEMPILASTNYLVKLTASNYTYYTQILKQE